MPTIKVQFEISMRVLSGSFPQEGSRISRPEESLETTHHPHGVIYQIKILNENNINAKNAGLKIKYLSKDCHRFIGLFLLFNAIIQTTLFQSVAFLKIIIIRLIMSHIPVIFIIKSKI